MSSKAVSLRAPLPSRAGNERRAARGFSDSVEEYVEGIFRLQSQVDSVSTGVVAAYMGVSAGSATTMVKKLAEKGLVHHEPYQGLRLSLSGERLAKRLIRAHRVLEAFLVQTLSLSWTEVHEPASKLSHFVPDDLIDRMETRIGGPLTCPHGNPVDPDYADGSTRLSQAECGRALRVVKVTDESEGFLEHLSSLGLSLGSELEVCSDAFVESTMNLSVGDRELTVGSEVGSHLWVVAATD